MENGVRKKRTLAERRESDKLRQRRFRAKKREEARLMEAMNGTTEKKERKERVCSAPKKTADQIRETNRIRQQRFRAKKRGEELPSEDVEPLANNKTLTEHHVSHHLPDSTTLTVPVCPPVSLPADVQDPVTLVQRIILQAATVEKTRQTEIRREKDRIRKRRERQRKKDRAMKQAGFPADEILKHSLQKKLEYLQKDLDRSQKFMNRSLDKEEIEEIEEEYDDEDEMFDDVDASEDLEILEHQEIEEGTDTAENPEAILPPTTTAPSSEFIDASCLMAQLEEMGLVLVTPADDKDGSLMFDIKQKTSEEPTSSEESTPSTSVTPSSTTQEMSPFPEKKPWQRCNSSEERRERERMRKRMYRAKQRFISTGKLEMQWDPAPIKRAPNDESEEGITPIPEWKSSLSSDQKLMAHRIYNKRYRERMKCSAIKEQASRRESCEKSSEELAEEMAANDFSNLPSDLFKQMLSTISQCDLSGLIAQAQMDE